MFDSEKKQPLMYSEPWNNQWKFPLCEKNKTKTKQRHLTDSRFCSFHSICFIIQMDFSQMCTRESVVSEEQYILNTWTRRKGPTFSFVLFADVSEGSAIMEKFLLVPPPCSTQWLPLLLVWFVAPAQVSDLMSVRPESNTDSLMSYFKSFSDYFVS